MLLYAPVARVRCFDASELPGSHGCQGREDDWQSIYRLVHGVSCPDQWSEEGLRGWGRAISVARGEENRLFGADFK